jgi:hypothetical protein
MLSSFGKKKSSTTKAKVMYCIKRTKAGRRVVKVEIVKRKGRDVKIYSSSRRVLGSTVKCFPRKTSAQAELTKLKKGVSFGSASTLKKRAESKVSKTPYGYLSCAVEDTMNPGMLKQKVFKYEQVRKDFVTYRVVVISEKYTGVKKVMVAREGMKVFPVSRTKGSAKGGSIKVQEALARAKAAKYGRENALLRYAGVPDLVECSFEDIGQIASASGASAGLVRAANAANSFEKSLEHSGSRIAGVNDPNLFSPSSQMDEVAAHNKALGMLNPRGRGPGIIRGTNKISDFLLHGQSLKMDSSGRQVRKDGARMNPHTGSMRTAQGSVWKPLAFGRSGFGRSSFGRSGFGRVNYGFSRYF